jgi:hypothetical protein
MSLLGKIFAILNIVAAVAFVVVAGMDWGQRQRWAYAVFRHDLLVNGLPIDDKEKDSDNQPRVNQISDKVVSVILPSSTGSPVKTQEQEVDRVRNLIRGKIDSNDVPGTRSQKLARYLLPLARTGKERDELMFLKDAPQNDAEAEKLEKRLNDNFDGVKASPTRSLPERKANAARLLFCLGEALHEDAATDFFASPAYKRFVNVVGLNGAARAADDQSLVIEQMTEEAIRSHTAERQLFVQEHGQTLYRTLGLSDEVERQRRLLNAKEKEAADAKALVDLRKVHITKLRNDLKNLQQTTADKLAEQTQAEQDVMQHLIELRDTGNKNQEFEREIRKLERLP